MSRSDPFDLPLPRERKTGSLSGKVHVFFHSVFALGYLWLCWHFPIPVGRALLWLTLAAVVMTISEVGPFHKAVWLVLVFALMFLENKSIDRDRKDTNDQQNKVMDLATKASSSSLETLGNVGLLLPRIGQIQQQLEDAKKSNNGKEVARLRGEKEAAQRQLLATMATGIVAELETQADKWRSADDLLGLQEHLKYSKPNFTESDRQQANAEFQRERTALKKQYCAQLMPLVATANSLREDLLERLPAEEDDKGMDLILIKVASGETVEWSEMGDATRYLAHLAKTFIANNAKLNSNVLRH